MQEKLIIYLRASEPNRPGWAVRDATGKMGQSAYQDNPEGLATLASQKEVIVIVPAEDVLLASATLPKMPRTRLLQAIPYALEEQLIDDVEALHFAVSDYHEDGSVSVAVVAKTKMQAWLSTLQAWNITADIIVPSTFALPFSQGVWHVLLDDTASIRSGLSQGFGCDKSNVITYLNLALSTAVPIPEQVLVRNYSESLPLHLSVDTKEELLSTEQMLEDMARQVCMNVPVNLLQGAFVNRKRARLPQLTNAWKAITYLSILFVALLFIYPLGSYLILKRQDSELQNQIAHIYRKNFPGGRSVVIAPKQRMEDKLHSLQGAMGDDRLLLLLGYIGKGLSESSGVTLKRFDFQSGQLTLQLTAANAQAFSAFNAFLTKQGLQLKQQNASLSGERVNATLQVE